MTLGVFDARDGAEEAIDALHRDLNIATGDISYVYRNTDGEVHEIAADEVRRRVPTDGVSAGALIGGFFGMAAGIATVFGVIPVIGAFFAAGPLLSILGLGAVGTVATAIATGVIVGSFVGVAADIIFAAPEKAYEDKAVSGGVLVAVYAREHRDVGKVLARFGAKSVESYAPSV